ALVAVWAYDASTAWAVGMNGTVLKTADGGATWSAQSSGTSAALNGIADANVVWAVGQTGGSGVVIKTTDGGANWTGQTPGGAQGLSTVAAVDASTAFVGGGNGAGAGQIYRTADGGATWTLASSLTFRPNTGLAAFDAATLIGTLDTTP